MAAHFLACLLALVIISAAPPSTHPAATTARSAAHKPRPSPSPTSTPDPTFGRLHWRELGPAEAGGRVAAVAGSASDPQLYYVGAAGGGVWKSEDGGTTWDSVFDRQPVASIGAIAIDPTDDKTVWVGTGEANPRNDVSYGDGVYKTTNGGDDWHNIGLRGIRNVARIAINPRDPNVALVAAFGDFFRDSPNGGIWRTADGGRTWQHTLYVGPQTGGSDLAIDPVDPNVVYAGLWQFRRVPWAFSSGGPDDGLYRSRDGGKTWTKLQGNGLPPGLMGRIGLAIAPSKHQRVYALIQSKAGLLWRSDDSGDHWSFMTGDTLVDQRPFYFSHIAVDPSNPDHVFAVSEMLAESKNGGKKFKIIADQVHVDYHAIWIAPNDHKRIIVGEDGGYSLSLNGGHSWSFSQNLAIGQVYHVGVDNRNPYWVCAALQDNNGFCGPSNGLSPDGIVNAVWRRVVGGDGMWTVPDPADENLVWSDLQDGNVEIFDYRGGAVWGTRPWFGLSNEEFNISTAPFRFNWDSPLAFAPWDPHTAWLGGNVVFQTIDGGLSWKVISPDLTRNVKSHQLPSGGPISLDVSSAESSDNLLDIEGSPLTQGEIWAGSDDGLIHLTRDGGAHWSNVTPRGAPAFARVETVAPSPLLAGTAYAVFDGHKSGDYRPYLYKTSDYGGSWHAIVAGLPADQYVRTVRPDIRNPHLLYAGTEQGIWISFDGGARWRSFQLNLPTVSVRDIRLQPTFDDIVIATHGRALWALDDVRPIQALPDAQAAGAALFDVRPVYQYRRHSDIEDLYDQYAAANPPAGAIINFYQAAKQRKPAVLKIVDSNGKVLRTISGTHKVKGHDVPLVSNDRGLNRVVWDLRENGPVLWLGAPNDDAKGPRAGALLPPGTYTARLTLAGRTFSKTFEVRPDPRATFSPADYQARYDLQHAHLVQYSNVDIALNSLDALKKDISKALAGSRPSGGAGASAAADLRTLDSQRARLFDRLTANYHNDEDSIGRPGALREELDGFTMIGLPITPALTAYAARVDTDYHGIMTDYLAFAARVRAYNEQARSAGGKTLTVPSSVAP